MLLSVGANWRSYIILVVCYCLHVSSQSPSGTVAAASAATTTDASSSSRPSTSNHKPTTTYGVIVDCGSSGTRAHIYEWDSELEYPELLNDIEPTRDPGKGKAVTKKITPGLASQRNNPGGASDYMQPIIDFVTEHIPREAWKATGVYILATAGMRLLNEETQHDIMEDIAEDLKRNYDFAKVVTRVISGTNEGMYQWIGVNSKLKRFAIGSSELKVQQQQQGRHQRAAATTSARTFAVIEMGGASIQVTYQLMPGMAKLMSNQLSLDSPEVGDIFRSQIVEPAISRETEEHNYQLFSTTFLGLGSNSARAAYIDYLIMRAEMSRGWLSRSLRKLYSNIMGHGQQMLVLDDPCMPRGAFETVQRPKKMLAHLKARTQTFRFTIERDDQLFLVKLEGAGNHTQCQRNMARMLFLAKHKRLDCKHDQPSCTTPLIGTPFVPFKMFEFLGLGDLYYTTNEMLNLAGRYDRSRILKKTKEICETRYKQLLRLYPSALKHDKSRVQEECFKAVWVDTFLTLGLRMPSNFQGFTTVGQIRGDEIEWTLGAVLDHSLAIEKAAEASTEAH